MSSVTLDCVSKTYGANVLALDRLTLDIAEGELLALAGPSGCGKTTLLRLIAGLEEPTGGTVSVGGKSVNGKPPAERNLAFVFQRPALYPQLTVRQNLAFSLMLRQHSAWWLSLTAKGREQAKARGERVNGTAHLLELDQLLERLPAQLSGGQQQRVALGRALVRQPEVLLLDEPLSNLDAGLRQELRRELHLLQRRLQATMVYVTHDPLEALSLGDRVAVLERGRLQQVDQPQNLLQRPRNRFVAGFFCWPRMNFLDGEIQPHGDALVFIGQGWSFSLPAKGQPACSRMAGRALTLGLRPQDVRIVDSSALGGWPMHVQLVESLGHGTLVTLTNGHFELTAWFAEGCQLGPQKDIMKPGNSVMVLPEAENVLLFDRNTEAALVAEP